MTDEKISWMSNQQVAKALANLDIELGHRTPTGKISVSEDALEGLRDKHPIIPVLLEYRAAMKLLGMARTCGRFVNPESGAIHSEWLQSGVPTGRFRSRNPNLQQIPEELRSFFVARPGQFFLACDYDQIELRLLSAAAREQVLIKAFQKGEDPHAKTASLMLCVPLPQITPQQRKLGKTLNYATLYGTGVRGLAHRLGVPTKKASELLQSYFSAVPALTRFLQKLQADAEIHGYVESYWGRRRPLPEIHSSIPRVQAFGRRSAVNGWAQSTAADVMKTAMLRLAEALPALGAEMLLTLHDAVLLEVPSSVPLDTAAATVRQTMETDFADLRLTVTISAGPDWGHLSKVNGI